MKTKQLQIRIDEELKKQFDTICENKFINASSLIRNWIENFVNGNKEEVKMKKLNYTKINGRRYQLPEGFYAIDTRFGDQVYNEHGENVTQKILGNANGDGYIILTDKGIVNLELLN